MKRYGVMLDCSRNGVMKVEQAKRFIDYLEKIGYNTLELYTEDTYEIKGEPFFGYMRGRYSATEIKEIDAYAKLHGIELVPCVQTLAHFTTMVRHEEYRSIVDVNDILLVDEPKTYQFIDKIFATLSQTFSSRLVNIGMDEAHMLGLGKYLEKNGYRDRFEIFLRHLYKVVEIAEKYGFKVHMWSDMFFRLANNGDPYGKNIKFPKSVVEKIPKNIELVYWDYYHYDKIDYDTMLDTYKYINRPVWFCGSVWTCGSFLPIWHKVVETMKPALQSVYEKDVQNILFAAWGDGGHECSYFAALPLLYVLRQYAEGNFDEQKINDGVYKIFGIKLEDFELLSKTNGYLGRDLYTNTMYLYNDCLLGLNDCFVQENGAVPYKEYSKRIQDLIENAGEFKYIFKFAYSLSKVLELKYDFGVRLRTAYKSGDKTILKQLASECDEIIVRIEEFYNQFKNLWHIENKPFGFEVITARIGAVILRQKDCKEKLLNYLNNKTLIIEELEEIPLPHQENNLQYSSLFSAGNM